MLKNYNYMLTIMIYPFILLLTFLKFSNYIKGDIYKYIIIVLLIIFIPSFIMSLYGAAEEILKSNKKWRIILLILLSIVYLPIYYTKYVSKEEKYLGYLLFIIAIPLSVITINATNKKLLTYFRNAYKNYVVINEQYLYFSKDHNFSINVDKTFRCNMDDIGDYVVYCDRIADDSFVGIYSYDVSYDSEEDIEEKLDFHINQTIEYIEEKGYNYDITDNEDIIQIDYNDNVVLITQRNYLVDDIKYSLVILKEMPKENISYEEYQKMIDSICFLNYNEGVSS